MDRLQQTLRQEQHHRLELEKELLTLKQKNQDLNRQLTELKTIQQRTQDMQRSQLDSVKRRLMSSLKHSMLSDGRFRCLTGEDALTGGDSTGSNNSKSSPRCRQLINTLSSYLHECDECTYKTKSDVSLILHKMNHQINEQQYKLSTMSFNTNNPNSKSVYQCSACDQAQLTRHQVYRHIYDEHTFERPISCPYCDLSFTHKDYLEQHIPAKHDDKQLIHKTTSQPQTSLSSLNNLLETPFSKNILETPIGNAKMMEPLIKKNRKSKKLPINEDNKKNNTFTSAGLNQPNQANQNNSPTSNISNTELKCTFPDCNFVTVFRDKLDFHMKAHVNTKYKCPYCPYVSNTIIDIKRHIQKSKKHEGMKMYSCQKCSFAADCDRQFKEHLRTYHFGFEAHDAVIDYFIEEMFSNKNKQRTDDEDLDAHNAMVMLLNNNPNSTPINAHNNPNLASINPNHTPNNEPSTNSTAATAASTQPHRHPGRPPTKKLATTTSRLANQTNVQTTTRLINLENVVQLTGAAGQQQQQQPQQVQRQTAYRGNRNTNPSTLTSNPNLHQATSTNPLVYHNLELAMAAIQQNTAANNNEQQFNSQPQIQITMPAQQPTHPPQQIQHSQHLGHVMSTSQQQQAQQLQQETGLLMPEQFVQAALNQAAASLVVQQQQAQQTSSQQNSTGNGNGEANNANNSQNNNNQNGGNGNGNPGVQLSMSTQYISYANY